MQPYVMDQQWVRIGDSDSSPLAGNVRRTGMVVGRVVDRGSESNTRRDPRPRGLDEISRYATQDEATMASRTSR
jgi:hypothetical protein